MRPTVWMLVLAFVACSGDKDSAADSGASGDSPTTVPDTDTDPTDTPSPGEPQHGLIADGLGGAILSVWGDSASNVWAVGADDGDGPLVLHYDGTAWERVDTGLTGDLWWVWGEGDTLFFSGQGGRVVRYTASTGLVEDFAVADSEYIFFGVWGSSADDVFAVAGDPGAVKDGVIYHFDGTEWTLSSDDTSLAVGTSQVVRSAFKVWGSAADDVWAIGTGSLFMHWDGTAWDTLAEPVDPAYPFTTVHGLGDEVYAVGGLANAVVTRWDGSTWVDDSPPPEAIAPRFVGVNVSSSRGAIAVGDNAALYTRVDGVWERDTNPPVTTHGFHGVWVDPDGGLWTVGGDLTSLDYGVMMYSGTGGIPQVSL